MADARNIDVFISYARGDEPWASQFVDELESQGVHAWYDKAEIALGERWNEKLEEALRKAPIVAVLIGPDYLTSPSTAFELGAAVADNKKIIPIVTQQMMQLSLPSLLRTRQFLHETSPQAAGKRVAAVVEHLARRNAAETN